MLHASGPSGYSLTLNVTSSAWYSGGDNWRTVGSVVDDTECKTKTGDPGWRGFHVHQDFMPPETSVESCQWNMNTSTDFHTGVTDRRRDDPDIWYIYSVSYVPGTPCLNPGPKVADKLLAPDGALDGDGNGAGTRALATGARARRPVLQGRLGVVPLPRPRRWWWGRITTIADFRRLITLGHSRSLLLRLANPDTGTTIKAHTLESSIGIVTTNGEEVFLGATSGVAILDPGPLALTPFTTLT